MRFSLQKKYLLQSFIRVLGHEASYMKTTNFAIILMLYSEGFDTHENLINVSVNSRNLPQVFHNVFLPFPRNGDTVSQPAKAYEERTSLHISSPKFPKNWIVLLCFQIPPEHDWTSYRQGNFSWCLFLPLLSLPFLHLFLVSLMLFCKCQTQCPLSPPYYWFSQPFR